MFDFLKKALQKNKTKDNDFIHNTEDTEAKIALLQEQRQEIYTKWDEYARFVTENLKGAPLFMYPTRELAITLDKNEGDGTGYYKSLFVEYLKEKRQIMKERHKTDGYLFNLCYDILTTDLENSIEGEQVTAFFVYPTKTFMPLPFNEDYSNIYEIYGGLRETMIDYEKVDEFMSALSELDKTGMFIEKTEDEHYIFKPVHYDTSKLAFHWEYDYNSKEFADGSKMTDEQFSTFLFGTDYTQKQILNFIDELQKVAEQVYDYEKQIEQINNTPPSEFLDWVQKYV